MPKKKESLETQVAVQEADIEYIKEALARVEKSLEQLQDKFLTKAEYFERGKIIEHLEVNYQKLALETENEIRALDKDVNKVKVWLKAISIVLGLVWPLILMLANMWINRNF